MMTDDNDTLTQVSGQAVTLFNDEHFAQCRAKLQIDRHILDGFTFENLAEGGGKGGDVMAFTPDRKYIVKGIGGDDQDALLRFAEVFCSRMKERDTLLSLILYHFRIADGDHAGTYFVMNNCLPDLGPTGFSWDHMFDLKGCCDDKILTKEGKRISEVHKRCFSIGTCWYGCDLACCCCNTPERQAYFNGKKYALTTKFPVTAEAKKYIDSVIAQDCDFLAHTTVTMDYSLILGIVKVQAGQESSLPKSPYHNQPFLVKTGTNETTAYYFGIIDFLQEWTTTKKIAHIIKCCCAPKPISTIAPEPYAVQFQQYFEDKFIVAEGDVKIDMEEGGEVKPTPSQAGVEMVQLSEEKNKDDDADEKSTNESSPLIESKESVVGTEDFPEIDDEDRV